MQGVAEYARSLPGVVHVANNMFSCPQVTQVAIADVIREHKLNRVVVAACTPRTHEPLFRETQEAAGLNNYLFAMANRRNHGSWVHAFDPEGATRKAKDLIRMAVASARHLAPSMKWRWASPVRALTYTLWNATVLGGNARSLCVTLGNHPTSPVSRRIPAPQLVW